MIDSMIGQEALNIAQGFRDNIPITGLILTKMDGDARGGAAISTQSLKPSFVAAAEVALELALL